MEFTCKACIKHLNFLTKLREEKLASAIEYASKMQKLLQDIEAEWKDVLKTRIEPTFGYCSWKNHCMNRYYRIEKEAVVRDAAMSMYANLNHAIVQAMIIQRNCKTSGRCVTKEQVESDSEPSIDSPVPF